LGLGLTFSLWIIQALVFGFLQIRWMTYGYVAAMIILAIKNRKYAQKWIKKVWRGKKSVLIMALIAGGVFLQILPISTSGFRDAKTGDIGWRYSNSVDGIMHLSFISELAQNFPPNRPDAAGEKLTNYHYLSDLWLADMARVWRLPINHLFFHYTPIIISLLTALALISVVKVFSDKKSAVFFALGMLFFASDSAYMIGYWLHRQLIWRTPIFDAGMEQFLNYPQTLAKLLFFISMWLLCKKKETTKEWVILWLIALPMMGIKIYYGAFYLAGLGLMCVVNMIREKKLCSPLSFLGLATLAGSGVIYAIGNTTTGSMAWIPVVWGEQLLQPPNLDDINWILFNQATHILRPLSLIKHYAWGVGVGIMGMVGMRIVGLGYFMRRAKKNWKLWAFCIIPILIFITLGINTMQNPGGLNTFNFCIVTANVLIIPTALLLSGWWQNKYLRGLSILAVLCMLPRNIEFIKKYGGDLLFNNEESEFILSKEEEGYLREMKETLPEGVIIQPDMNFERAYSKNSYVHFFTNRHTYLSAAPDGPISGYKEIMEPREERLQEIWLSGDLSLLKTQLGIDYLYTEQGMVAL